MPAKCDNCGGNLVEAKVTIEERFDDLVVTADEVPALVCDTCGERLIPGPVLEDIERQAENMKEQKRRTAKRHIRLSPAC